MRAMVPLVNSRKSVSMPSGKITPLAGMGDSIINSRLPGDPVRRLRPMQNQCRQPFSTDFTPAFGDGGARRRPAYPSLTGATSSHKMGVRPRKGSGDVKSGD